MMRLLEKHELRRIVEAAAQKNGCDPDVAIAIAMIESSWDTYAVKYEPNWKYLESVEAHAKADHITGETELQLQKFSWGLMQVMGSVARELGFTLALPMLCIPEFGAEYGTKKLAKLFRRYPSELDVIAAYNAGSPRKTEHGFYVNQGYVNKVKSLVDDLRATAPKGD